MNQCYSLALSKLFFEILNEAFQSQLVSPDPAKMFPKQPALKAWVEPRGSL